MKKAQWWDVSWSPITGCTPVGEGCKNCWAAGMAKRFWGDRKFGEVRFHPERLDIPMHWRKPRRIFVCSMADLFHASISDDRIHDVYRSMQIAERHTFIVLTKRIRRAKEWYIQNMANIPIGNIWLGVSVSNQKEADNLIPELLKIPAAVRFVSYEPAIEEVSFRWAAWEPFKRHETNNHLDGLRRLSWVIIGCESGARRRPMKIEWSEMMVEQCKDVKIPVWVKQLDINGKCETDINTFPEALRIREYPEQEGK